MWHLYLDLPVSSPSVNHHTPARKFPMMAAIIAQMTRRWEHTLTLSLLHVYICDTVYPYMTSGIKRKLDWNIQDTHYNNMTSDFGFRRREIARKKKYECSKCMYDIPPFTPHFDPESHNEFTKRRANFLTRNNEKRLLEGILRQRVEENYRGIFERPFTWRQLLCEILLVGKSDAVSGNQTPNPLNW